MAKNTGRQRQNPRVTLPTMRKPPAMPRGPRMFAPLPKAEWVSGGPGDPPPGFITATNSVTEWIVWWALCKIFDPTGDPRAQPFDGRWPYFSYQMPFQQGRHDAGGAVIDFVVFSTATHRFDIALRVQTEFFHIFTTPEKQAYDVLQRDAIEASGLNVIDIYDQDVLGDRTGAKAIVTIKNALGMIERPNPIQTGTAIRATRLEI